MAVVFSGHETSARGDIPGGTTQDVGFALVRLQRPGAGRASTPPKHHLGGREEDRAIVEHAACALAARAITNGALAEPPGETAAQEGWIVVHR